MTDKQIIIDDYFRKIVDINGKIVDYEIKNSDVSKMVQKIEKYNSYIEAKEQECEGFKKANDGILTALNILAKNNIKLRETLTEIKEIAEENIRIADLEGLNGVYRRGLAKQILQKISECEVKDEM